MQPHTPSLLPDGVEHGRNMGYCSEVQLMVLDVVVD